MLQIETQRHAKVGPRTGGAVHRFDLHPIGGINLKPVHQRFENFFPNGYLAGIFDIGKAL